METKREMGLDSFGKGLIQVRFEIEIDFEMVWSRGPWKICNQLIRLNEWTRNFKPEWFRQTKAIIWVQFPNLPIECLDEEVVLAIGRSVGFPVRVDDATYPRLLVTMPKCSWISI